MTRKYFNPLKLLSAAALMLAAGCASVEPSGARAGGVLAKAQAAEMAYAYTGSRIPSRYSTSHVVQVNGTDYQRSLPSNPGTPLMATGANGPGGAR